MKCEGKPVVEIPYKAESIHLLSHVEYLNYNPNRVNPLVKQVAYWLLRGGKFEVPRTGWGWPDEDRIRIYQYIRYFIWLISGLAISEILGFFVSRKLPDFISWLSLNVLDLFFFEEPLDRVGEMLDLSLFSNPFLYLFGSAILVFWFGVMARALDRWRPSRSRSGR
jgi:hypothetical protein